MRRGHDVDRGPPTAFGMVLRLSLIILATAAICSCTAFFEGGL